MSLLSETIDSIERVDHRLIADAQERLDRLTKPLGSLGRLEELARRVVGITGQTYPVLRRKVVVVMAADHGVTEEGVSAYPSEVTAQMVYNFARGGAAINVLARHTRAEVKVVDIGVAADLDPHPAITVSKIGYGTRNFTKGPAMSRAEATRAVEVGIALVQEMVQHGLDIIAIGDMGIGNTTPSSAIIAAFTGLPVQDVTGRGTGIDDETFRRKVEAITRGLAVNRPDPGDPMDLLAKVGGFEIAGLAGCALGAAAMRIPVVLDGFISTAGALIAAELAPNAKEYMIAGHKSAEIGHKVMLDRMGLVPLLDLDLRLGEGTGAVLAMGLVEAGLQVLSEMATFESAGVSQKPK